MNLFRYLTFRSAAALMTALILNFMLTPVLISWLKKYQHQGQPIRPEVPIHIPKQGTPTMGGVTILLSFCMSTLLWIDLTEVYTWIVLLIAIGYGVIGFVDDYLKVIRGHSKGISAWTKLTAQVILAIFACLWFMYVTEAPLDTHITIPFFKDFLLDLGWFFVFFGVFVMVGASNAVNLTDGLDGLAIVLGMIVAASFGIITYLVGNLIFANYLQIRYVPGTGELAILCAALIGAGLGFLWFNAPPAKIFMGDTGSLSIGGTLGVLSVVTKHEVVFGIIGGLFVLETVSVMVQVLSYKLTKKRIILMAPLHHHFEQKGWSEATIVIRFWIIAIILALIGLSTLKIR